MESMNISEKNRRIIDKKGIFLVIDACNRGTPGFIHSEGILKKHILEGDLYFHAEHLSRNLPAHPQPIDLTHGYTESQIIRNYGYKAITIGAFSDETALDSYPNDGENIMDIYSFAKSFLKTMDDNT